MNFIDMFAGCGGLSLGLMKAGWEGVFAVEKNSDAFKTIKYNLISGENKNSNYKYNWPEWLPIEAIAIESLLTNYNKELISLRDKVDMVVGGPPCQGFSFAGRRTGNDPRNELFRKYLELVDLLKPKFIVIENVKGIGHAFKKKGMGKLKNISYAEIITSALSGLKYNVQQGVLKAVEFGVPQLRPRYFIIGVLENSDVCDIDFFEEIRNYRKTFLKSKNLSVDKYITAKEAISDLKISNRILIDCIDSESPSGFLELGKVMPRTNYQLLMHEGLNGSRINSLRLPRHKKETLIKFKKILKRCKKGFAVPAAIKKVLHIEKHMLTPLSPNKPSKTITTSPDDLLHYSEPRIHTVREHARLQSFPDWFEFKGKYTSGGLRRRQDCPRYTQVGNAVPPLLAEVVGVIIARHGGYCGFPPKK